MQEQRALRRRQPIGWVIARFVLCLWFAAVGAAVLGALVYSTTGGRISDGSGFYLTLILGTAAFVWNEWRLLRTPPSGSELCLRGCRTPLRVLAARKGRSRAEPLARPRDGSPHV